jgi:hypothetical protein
MESAFAFELCFLHVKGATSFESLRTVDGLRLETFREAVLALHLLEDDREWHACLNEASLFKFGPELHHLFAIILVNCSPSEPLELWKAFKKPLSEDIFFKAKRESADQISSIATTAAVTRLMEEAEPNVLYDIDDNLRTLGSSLKDFSTLPQETSRSIIGEPKS